MAPEAEPEQDTFVDDFLDSFRRSAYYGPLMHIRSLLGDEEGAQRIQEQLATDPALQTSNEVASFLGEVAGSVAPTAAALVAGAAAPAAAPLIATGTAAYFGAQAIGAGQMHVRNYRRARGEEPTAAEEWTVGLGYGAAEFLAERYGLKALARIGGEGARLIGKRVLKEAAAKDPRRVQQLLSLGAKAAAAGAAEETASLAMRSVVDMIYDEEGSFVDKLIQDLPREALQGAVGGVLAGGIGAAARASGVRTPEGQNAEVEELDLPGQGGTLPGFARRYFTSRGDLPQTVFEQKLRSDAWLRSQQKDALDAAGDLKGAIRQVFGRSLSPDQAQVLDSALKGEIDVNTLDEPLRAPIVKMRQHIDALSRKMIDEGIAEGDLAVTIDENMGVYVTRAYRAFDDPDWAASVPEDVRNRAKGWVRKEYEQEIVREIAERQGVDEAEASRQYHTEGTPGYEYGQGRILGIIDELLYKDASSPIGTLASAGVSQRVRGILKRREAIPDELRALWGEYRDPVANYTKSIMRMGELIARSRFVKEAIDANMGTLFHTSSFVSGTQRFTAPLTVSPGRTVYTLPEIAEAMTQQQPSGSPIFTGYMKALGATKTAKTVLSPMTQARNFLANVGFLIGQGHLNPLDPVSLVRTFSPDGFAHRAFRALRNKGEARAYATRLTELGVIGDDVRSGELQDIFRDAGMLLEGQSLEPERLGKRMMNFAQKLYQGSDAFFKVIAYESELARLRAARPNDPVETLERRAADIVRNTLPTYSMVPRAARLLRRSPLLGTFVSFPAEVLRTTYHTARLIRSELADPDLRAIGARRLAGFVTAMAAPTAFAAYMRAQLGVTKEEEDDLRRFVAPWQKNAQLAFSRKGTDGTVDFFDLSYLDPYDYVKRPFVAFLNGQNEDEAIAGFIGEFFSPFLSEEMLTARLADIARNTTETGGQVYNPEAPFEERASDMLMHVWDAFEPGAIRGARRIIEGVRGQRESFGRTYDPVIEAQSQLTGVKRERLDILQAVGFRARDFSRSLRDANRIFTQTATRRGRVTAEEIQRSQLEMERTRRALFDEMHADARAAVRLGLTERQVYQALRTGGIGKRDAKAILNGRYIPYRGADELFERAQARARVASTQEDAARSLRELQNRQRALQ